MWARQAALVYWPAVSVDDEPWTRLAQRQGLFQASSTRSVGICAAKYQPTTRREQASRHVAK